MDAAQRCSCVNGKCTEIHSDLLSRNSLCNRLAGGILKFLCIQPAIQDVFTFVNDCKAAESLLIMLELKCNPGITISSGALVFPAESTPTIYRYLVLQFVIPLTVIVLVVAIVPVLC